MSEIRSKPQLLAWITCDGVHIDPATGKHTLLGVFSSIRAKKFPVTHPRMVWFLSLADIPEGTHELRISMGKDLLNPKSLLTRKFQSPGPFQRINLINEIRNLSFDSSGDFSIIIEVNDETVLVASMQVIGS